MFGKKDKKDPVNNLSHELDRARAKRDALTSDVTALSTQIAEMEARLSEERERRERERVTGAIEEITKQLEDSAATFSSVIARLCDATAAAAAEIIPEARELNSLLAMVATEVDSEIESLLCALRRRAETVRTGESAECPSLPAAASKRARVNERLPLLLPAFLPRNREVIEAAEERSSTAA